MKELFKMKIFGILAAETKGKRGNCYTLIAARFLWLIPFVGVPVGMIHERDKSGEPTKDFDKIIII